MNLDLHFDDPLEKGVRANPIAQIFIREFSRDDSDIFISPHCVSYSELEYAANMLIEELGNIKKKAKKKFAKAKERRKSL